MDAAFCISIKTRPNRAERQSPDQHAANSEAIWFFCSVIQYEVARREITAQINIRTHVPYGDQNQNRNEQDRHQTEK
jgi:hypothetical protein